MLDVDQARFQPAADRSVGRDEMRLERRHRMGPMESDGEAHVKESGQLVRGDECADPAARVGQPVDAKSVEAIEQRRPLRGVDGRVEPVARSRRIAGGIAPRRRSVGHRKKVSLGRRSRIDPLAARTGPRYYPTDSRFINATERIETPVARTVNVEEHAVRRDAFVDAAAKRIQTQGYEVMSIQDVLDDVDASRGAFYHYFDSKQALLEAVIERMGDAVIASLGGLLDDVDLPAPNKLERVFSTIASYKAARYDLVMAILDVWLSDDNAIVREKFRRYVAWRMTPILVTILRQGVREGSMGLDDPDDAAVVIVTLITGLNELAGHLFVAHRAGTASIESILATFGAYTAAMERILGLPSSSLHLIDEGTLRWWFAQPMKEHA
jgi:AcrR family transcriptional regulator